MENTSSNYRLGLETLSQFIVDHQKRDPFDTGKLKSLLHDISIAAKIVNREVRKAGLVDILGTTGDTNVQGEKVQKLDHFANEVFISALQAGGECCAIASEESENVIPVAGKNSTAPPYVVLMDPIDGSSNTDVNVTIGSIFSVYKRVSPQGKGSVKDCLQKGINQVAAGYIVYGSSTMLVFANEEGVNGFTLDPSIGEFCLSHPNIKIPENGEIYSINEGNYNRFQDGIKKYIKHCQDTKDGTIKPLGARNTGSLVADFHRNLLKGGIFIYPASSDYKNGKLRLAYECNPMAYIAEKAGGKASNGFKRILDLDVTRIHQRTPLIIGSPKMVSAVEGFLKEHDSDQEDSLKVVA